MKPIPTVGKPLPSIDLVTGEAAEAVYERSDVCSVPAASVVGEAMVALVILDAALETVPAPDVRRVPRESRGLAGSRALPEGARLLDTRWAPSYHSAPRPARGRASVAQR